MAKRNSKMLLAARDDGPQRAVITGTNSNDQLWGTAEADTISGLLGDDVIRGGSGDDTLYGNEGDDVLIGQAGNDTMVGGAGNDTYVLVDAGDVIVENAGEGIDTVQAWRKHALGANVENLMLMGNVVAGEGNGLNNVITGNSVGNWLYGYGGDDTIDAGAGDDRVFGGEGNDVLFGREGDDWLDSGTGADSMMGGLGNDTYVVDNVGDLITEYLGEGTDTVRSWISWTLQAELENLTLLGGAVSGTGNSGNNVLIGNAGTNYLAGLEGDDRLDGGAGNDYLYGGMGNDTFVVTDTGDQTIEYSGQGTDTVEAWIGWTLSANVENLVLMGMAVGGGGNALNNVIVGNAADNHLYGYAGDDALIGGAGNDTLSGGSGADLFIFAGGFGNDTIIDFYAAPGLSDMIRFSTDDFADFDAVMAAASNGPGGVVITTSDGRSVTLQGVTKSQLSADDFEFVGTTAGQVDHNGLASYGLDDFDPLVLPGDSGAKAMDAGPAVCPTFETESSLAFVWDVDSSFSGRDPHRLAAQPTANDWVF